VTRRRALVLLTAALLIATPSAAVGATTLGSPGAPTGSCAGPGTLVETIQIQRANGAKDAAPAPGIITSWTYDQGAGESVVTLRTYRPTATANQYTVLAEDGAPRTLAANSGAHTFPTRLPVNAGDTIGLRVTSGTCLTTTSSTNDKLLIKAGPPTPVGGTVTFPVTSSAVTTFVTAVLEPDADHDGYGDETQDRCPQLASTQRACPPDTAITKKPKRHSHKPKSKLTFTSTAAGSTFSCSIDGKTAKGCTSPATYKCLKPGKHTFSVVATEPTGVVDPTPATTKFRVSADRHGC